MYLRALGRRHSHHCGVRHPGCTQQSTLHILRVYFLTAGQGDHILLAPMKAKVTVLLELAEIARLVPAVLESRRRRRGVLPVTLSHARALDQYFAVFG